MSFRLKTILGIAAIEAALLVLLVWNGLSYLHTTNETALETRAVTSARMFAATIKNAAMSSDIASLRSFFDEVATDRDLAYARLIDSSGRVLAQRQKTGLQDSRVVSASFDIAEGGINFGRVEIGFDAGSVDSTIGQARTVFVTLAAVEMVLVAGFSFLLGSYLTRRLKLLKDGADAISQGNIAKIDYDGSHDEIGTAIHAFNDMADGLRKGAAEIEEAQRKVVAALERAEAGSRAKSEFLATMSHEIRTPLNGIMGGAQLLLDEVPGGGARERVKVILQSSDRLLLLLNDVLDFSKIEAGKLELAPRPVDLVALTAGIVPLFGPGATAKGILLRVEHPDHPVWVNSDPDRVFQILANLVNNAVKFTKTGEVVVTLACCAGGPQAVSAMLSVRDTGIGIPAEAQTRLFSPFTQADAKTSIQYGGTGLGLAIVQRLVTLLKGSISVTSTPGQGTTFTIALDFDAAPAPALTEADAASLHPEDSSICDGYPQARILVAEDDTTNQSIISLMLERLRIRPDLAVDGSEALRMFKEGRYDLVLMDYRMPNMDGIEATRRIRQYEAETGAQPVPILATSANTSQDDRRQFLAAGMDDLLEKPLRLTSLRGALAHWLHHRAAGPEAAPPPPAEPPISDLPVLDLGYLQEIGESLGEHLKEVLKIFVAAAPETIREIDDALGRGDIPQAAKAAHRLKGSSRGVGAVRLGDCASRMEMLAKAAGPLEDLSRLAADLRNELDQSLQELAPYVA